LGDNIQVEGESAANPTVGILWRLLWAPRKRHGTLEGGGMLHLGEVKERCRILGGKGRKGRMKQGEDIERVCRMALCRDTL